MSDDDDLKDIAAKHIGYAFWAALHDEREKHAQSVFSRSWPTKDAFLVVAAEMVKHLDQDELDAIESFSGWNLCDLYPEDRILGRAEFEHFVANPDHPDYKKPTYPDIESTKP